MEGYVNFTGKEPASLLSDAMQRRYGVISGGLNWLLPQGLTSELLHGLALNPVLLAPAGLRGIGNVRGVLLPVFDLAQLVGLASHSKDEHVLMLGAPPQVAGILVTGYPRALSELSPCETANIPDDLRAYCSGTWESGATQWLELDVMGLLHDLARQKQRTN